jgi:polyisoprenoid-binding protein YceI
MIKILGGLAVAAVLVLGAAAAGWWLLIREDDQLATSAPDIPDEVAAATAAATEAPAAETTVSETADGLAFEINSELSEAAYFVDEELASLGLPSTAKGATNEVSGTIYLTSEGGLDSENPSVITVDLRNLTSDEERRDQRVQHALATSTYPTATFTVTSVTGYDASIPEGEEQPLQLTGVMDLHGVQKEVTWEVLAFREGNAISALATLTIAFDDFGITPPTFQGLVSISDEATLQIQLIAELA